MATINVDTIIGIPVVLPVITPWAPYTVLVGNLGAGGIVTAKSNFRQVGDSIDVDIAFSKDASNGTGGATVSVSLPNSYTAYVPNIVVSGSSNPTVVGYLYSYNINTGSQYVVGAAIVSGVDGNKITFLKMGAANALTGADFRLGGEFSLRITSLQITQLVGQANVAYGAGQATSAKAGLVSREQTATKIISVYAGATTTPNVTIRQSRIGNVVTITIPAWYSVTKSASAGVIVLGDLDVDYRPSVNTDVIVLMAVAGTTNVRKMNVNVSGAMNFYGDASGGNIAANAIQCGSDQSISFSYSVA